MADRKPKTLSRRALLALALEQQRELDARSGAEDAERALAARLERALEEERSGRHFARKLRSVVYALVVLAAAAAAAWVLLTPVVRVYGGGMSPTLSEGDVLFCRRTSKVENGEIAVFNYNNKLLVKRVVAQGGQTVDIDAQGVVYVDGAALEEPYLTERALGTVDIELPFTVPPTRLFVLGDDRAASADSRVSVVGCVAEEQLIGRAEYRIWPLDALGAPD